MHKLEQRKQTHNINSKWARVTTVILYIIFVSLFGVILGLYYGFWWMPNYSHLNDASSYTNSSEIASFHLKPVLDQSGKPLNVSKLLNVLMKAASENNYDLSNDMVESKYASIENNGVEYKLVISLLVSCICFPITIKSILQKFLTRLQRTTYENTKSSDKPSGPANFDKNQKPKQPV